MDQNFNALSRKIVVCLYCTVESQLSELVRIKECSDKCKVLITEYYKTYIIGYLLRGVVKNLSRFACATIGFLVFR